MTVLLTTHYLDEAERLCDRIAIMHDGQLAGLGRPKTLRDELGQRIVEFRGITDAVAAVGSLHDRGIVAENAFGVGHTLTIPLHGDCSAADAIAALDALRLPEMELRTRPPTLDDVYLRLTGERLAA
jgi:ABC-2 type transport system ATP-binding protein